MSSDTITPERTLERVGQISGFLFLIPGLAIWLYIGIYPDDRGLRAASVMIRIRP